MLIHKVIKVELTQVTVSTVGQIFLNLGSSDRFAAVLKSHVRRYLNEKHDVTNAEEFVEACRSYGGVKNVNVVQCKFTPAAQSMKFKFNHIRKFRSFCYERHGIRAFRAWNVGEGQLFPCHKLIPGVRYLALLFNEKPL